VHWDDHGSSVRVAQLAMAAALATDREAGAFKRANGRRARDSRQAI
jgi:hypothetical protein